MFNALQYRDCVIGLVVSLCSNIIMLHVSHPYIVSFLFIPSAFFIHLSPLIFIYYYVYVIGSEKTTLMAHVVLL